MRSSPLVRRYSWGVHSNAESKIAIFPVESDNYKELKKDEKVTHLKGMRNKKTKN